MVMDVFPEYGRNANVSAWNVMLVKRCIAWMDEVFSAHLPGDTIVFAFLFDRG